MYIHNIFSQIRNNKNQNYDSFSLFLNEEESLFPVRVTVFQSNASYIYKRCCE